MARSELDANVTLSLLDRLVDLEPSLRTDPPQGRSQSLRQLKASLRRDIEWLLNTRRSIEEIKDSSLQIEHSLFNYGLPDITALGIHSTQDQNRLLWMIESTIATFEPRIRDPRVTMEAVAGNARVLRFQIQGLLRIDPAPERVTFDTVLELTSGEYEVKGD
jgi:type VI secretion system protein ImpF